MSYTLEIKERPGYWIVLDRGERTARQEGPAELVAVGAPFQRAATLLERATDVAAKVALRVQDTVRATARERSFGSEGQLGDLHVWHRLSGRDHTGKTVYIDIRFRLDPRLG